MELLQRRKQAAFPGTPAADGSGPFADERFITQRLSRCRRSTTHDAEHIFIIAAGYHQAGMLIFVE